jgi:hypothetical protein
VRQQVGDPRRVGHVALAAGHVAAVHRIGQDEAKVFLKHMPDGLPVDARRLHRHVGTTLRREPLVPLEQPPRRRGDRSVFVGDVDTTGDSNARGDAAGVHVQTSAPWIQDFHIVAPSRTLAWSPRWRNLRCAVSAAIRGACGTPGPTRERALSTNGKPTSAPASPDTVTCFMTTWARRRRVGN